jgi:hypothetical protein
MDARRSAMPHDTSFCHAVRKDSRKAPGGALLARTASFRTLRFGTAKVGYGLSGIVQTTL